MAPAAARAGRARPSRAAARLAVPTITAALRRARPTHRHPLAAASFTSTTALAPGSVATAVAIAAASLAAGSLATAVAIAAAATLAATAATTAAASASAANPEATAHATAIATTSAKSEGRQPQHGVLGRMQRTAGCLPWLLRTGWRLLPPGLGGLARCVR